MSGYVDGIILKMRWRSLIEKIFEHFLFGILSLPIIRVTTSNSNATLNFILFQSLGIIQFKHKNIMVTKFGSRTTQLLKINENRKIIQ